MLVSLKWLRAYVATDLPASDVAHRLTMAGLEVTAQHAVGEAWEDIYTSEVRRLEQHPNADRLLLATVDYGEGRSLQIVTGAPNLREGAKVPLALVGAQLWDNYADPPKQFRLKASRIRGIRSEGMVCSARELGIGDDATGILILPPDTPVGLSLEEVLGDLVLELDIKGPRADCLSMLGVARELAAMTMPGLHNPMGIGGADLARHTGAATGSASGTGLQVPPAEIARREDATQPPATVQIADPDLCSRYVAIVVRGVTVGESPGWMQERLNAAGLRPINNIVDITNYVMLEWGQPLHAFDLDTLRGQAIIVRRAAAGEQLITLDGEGRILTPEMLVIADAARPVALAGVMGGASTEVGVGTTAVLIESASFDPVSIRRTRRALTLPTEASRRFEKGLPPELPLPAALRAAALMVELAGGTMVGEPVDAFPRPRRRTAVELRPYDLERLLGMTYPPEQVTRTLQALGFEVAVLPDGEDGWLVTPPIHRTDVAIPEDLVEEVARIIGYDAIPSTLLTGGTPRPELDAPLYWETAVRQVLTAAGYDEIIAYTLTNRERLARLPTLDESPAQREQSPRRSRRSRRSEAAGDDLARWVQERVCPAVGAPVMLANPLSSDRDVLRTSAIPDLLETAQRNLRQADGDVCLFELGRLYLPTGAGLPEERRVLTAVVTQHPNSNWSSAAGWGSQAGAGFFHLKGAAEEALARLGVRRPGFIPLTHPAFAVGPAAAIISDHHPESMGKRPVREGQVLGALGALHRDVARAFDLGGQCVVLALDFDRIIALAGDHRQFDGVARYPAVMQDLAVVLDEAVPAEQVEALMRRASRQLLTHVRLFDVYQGEQVPAGQRSLAFTLTFQAPDRTLTDAEVEPTRQRIIGTLKRQLGASLRGGS